MGPGAGMRTYIHTKVVQPITHLLKQGITPEKISLSIAWGVVIGIFPVVGTTTLLCAIVAIVLRLNLPIIQLANWLVYPLQLLLVAPFFFAGAYLFGSEPFTQDARELIVLFRNDLLSAVILLKDIILHAVLVWLCMAPVGIILLYWVLKPLLKKFPVHRHPAGISSTGFRRGKNSAGDDRSTP
jgi:uncharacterized protein (DUF2062 family)